MSEVGQTQTLPEDGVEKASMAVVSCANYPAGYFHVYREILNQHEQSPFDVVLHLGDYIYEYGAGGYASEDAAALGREPSKGTECITLDDYRKDTPNIVKMPICKITCQTAHDCSLG